MSTSPLNNQVKCREKKWKITEHPFLIKHNFTSAIPVSGYTNLSATLLSLDETMAFLCTQRISCSFYPKPEKKQFQHSSKGAISNLLTTIDE